MRRCRVLRPCPSPPAFTTAYPHRRVKMSSVHRVRMMVSKWASQRSFSVTPTLSSHKAHNVGVLALETYIPSRFVSQTELEKADGISAGKYTVGMLLCQ